MYTYYFICSLSLSTLFVYMTVKQMYMCISKAFSFYMCVGEVRARELHYLHISATVI